MNQKWWQTEVVNGVGFVAITEVSQILLIRHVRLSNELRAWGQVIANIADQPHDFMRFR